MRVLTLFLAAALTACRTGAGPAAAVAPRPDAAALTEQMRQQFARSARDWNRGDLDGFMSDYAAESTTTYVDGFRPRQGFDFIRGVYSRRFRPGVERDSLHFEEIAARPLSPALALVTGRFFLQRAGATTASGPFTLVMERRPEGWRILHDHTSSDPR
jgi:ketosteroid isomerase-like protein